MPKLTSPIPTGKAPQLTRFVDSVIEQCPILASTILGYLERLAHSDNAFYHDAEHLVDTAEQLVRATGGDDNDLLDAFADFCIEYLREQNEFMANGSYSGTEKGFDAIVQEVYSDNEYMFSYMIGHLLSCALFPHHYAQYRLFINDFLPHVLRDAKCCELGVGHGLWLSSLLCASPERTGLGFDVSEMSVSLCRHMMHLRGIAADRYDVQLGDVVKEDYPADTYGAIIASGLLEHIEDPPALLNKCANALIPKAGRMFVMVPANLSHPDHLVLYESVDEIRHLYRSCGLTIVAEVAAPTQEVPEKDWQAQRVPIVHTAVLKR